MVDDGIATGSTARAACQVARAHGAARVVLAVPVAPQASIDALASVADEVICAEAPEPFLAIGQWYRDFEQTGDDEVVGLLRQAASATAEEMERASTNGTPADRDVIVLAGAVPLPGRLTIPAGARGVVVFAHGSGSSRNSPRNMFVAGTLHVVGLGSLLFDLLTPEEEADRANVFDVGLLAGRLSAATTWAPRAARAAAGPGWGTSGPAPGWPRRCGPPPGPGAGSRPWFPAVDVPTWPGQRWPQSGPLPCSSLAGWTTGCSS